MTKEEAIEKLNAVEEGDNEFAHIEADRILVQFLTDNELKDVADAFRAAEDRVGGFWYA